jgi:hypothetical protein
MPNSEYNQNLEESLANVVDRSTLVLLILVVGIVGNSFNLAVFAKASMRKVSTFRYLFYLAIFDLLLLLVCSSETLLAYSPSKLHIRSVSKFVCKVHSFLVHFFGQMSSALLVIAHADRVHALLSLRPANESHMDDSGN